MTIIKLKQKHRAKILHIQQKYHNKREKLKAKLVMLTELERMEIAEECNKFKNELKTIER